MIEWQQHSHDTAHGNTVYADLEKEGDGCRHDHHRSDDHHQLENVGDRKLPVKHEGNDAVQDRDECKWKNSLRAFEKIQVADGSGHLKENEVQRREKEGHQEDEKEKPDRRTDGLHHSGQVQR